MKFKIGDYVRITAKYDWMYNNLCGEIGIVLEDFNPTYAVTIPILIKSGKCRDMIYRIYYKHMKSITEEEAIIWLI